METLCSYKPCYCNNTFCLEGEYFLEGEIYLFEKINSGVWSIDDMGVTEDYEDEYFYEIMYLDECSKGYIGSLEFEDNFELLEYEIRAIDRLFNKIMNGNFPTK